MAKLLLDGECGASEAEKAGAPISLEYASAPAPRRWRTAVAVALTVPTGVAAGLLTYAAGYGSLVALGFFSLACPLVLGLLARRLHVLIGVTVSAALSATLWVKAVQFEQEMGRSVNWRSDLGMIAIVFAISAFLSLIVSLSISMAKAPPKPRTPRG